MRPHYCATLLLVLNPYKERSKMKIKFHLFVVLLLAGILLSGCNLFSLGGGNTVTLEGEQREQALSYAQPIAEGVLEGILNSDYETFSRDFDSTMKNGMDRTAFQNLLDTFTSKIGQYQSHEVLSVLQDEKYSIVIFRLVYSQDDQVTMRVVLDRNEPHQVTGLWFDSPELRKR